MAIVRAMTSLHPALDRLLAAARGGRPAGRTRWVSLRPGALDDVAGWLGAEFPSAEVMLVADAHTFDAAGQGVEEGKKSVAIEVTLQPGEKSFTEGELKAISDKVVKAAEKVGANLRG